MICLAIGILTETAFSAESTPEATLAAGISALADAAEGLRTRSDYGSAAIDDVRDFLRQYSDLERAGRVIISEHWKTTQQQQRSLFSQALEQRVVNMVIDLIIRVDFDTVIIEPFNGDHRDIPITMGVNLRTIDGEKIRFELRMHPLTGEWRILDVSAEGVSYLKLLRSEFRQAAVIYGIDEAIARFTR